MSRSELVEALKAVKWDSPIEVFIGTMDGPVGFWPEELRTVKNPVQLLAGTRRLETTDYFAEFVTEIANDLERIRMHPEYGITRFGVYFFAVPYLQPNLVRYAKATNAEPKT